MEMKSQAAGAASVGRGSLRREPSRRRAVVPWPTVIRTPTKRPVLLCALALASGAACAASGDRGKGEAKMRVVRSEKSVEVEAGTRIDLVVTRPVATPAELGFEWPATPSVEGDAVRFVRLRIEAPPPDVDGGVTTHHYELEGTKPGAARVTLAPRLAGPRAAQPPVVLDVTVRAAGAAAAVVAGETLAALVVGLADRVATSPESPVEIARRFGAVEADTPGAVYVAPADPRLKKVIVAKRHGTAELNDVELQLATPGALAVAELEALWGAPGRPPALAIETRTLLFRPTPPAGSRFQATVAVTVEGTEDGPVTWVKVIRDRT